MPPCGRHAACAPPYAPGSMGALLGVALLLAFANGANDNLKGVATLIGSGTAAYRRALVFATAATLAGSVLALVLAQELLVRFSGRGLVPPEIVADPIFVGSVAFGAGATVLLATRLGMPTSTTHALVGALLGAGLAAGGAVRWGVLAGSFVVPLLFSPLVAVFGTMALYPLLHRVRRRLGVTSYTCLCVGSETVEVVPETLPTGALALERRRVLSARLATAVDCRLRYGGGVLGLRAAPVLDALHYVSAGAVCFARGVNDTPKIAALLLLAPALGARAAVLLTGVVIALGGLLAARRVTRTMSHGITPMNAGQGFTTNVVTAGLVLVASPLGLPVSTTHVSNGALFGLGLVTRAARAATIGRILATWILTVPAAALLAAGARALL